MFVHPGHIAHPCRHTQCDPVQRPALGQQIPCRTQQPLRQFLRAIHRDLPRPVAQGRIAEALQQRPAIGRHIRALRNDQGQGNIVTHHPLDKTGQGRITHGLGHGFIARQITQIGQRRMGSVEHAELHGFERQDIGHQLRAEPAPIGATEREMILDHPLGKRLGHDRPSIHDPRFGQNGPIGIGGRGHDPVNHGRGKCHLLRDGVGQGRIAQLRKTAQHFGDRMAIGGQIVAGQHGKRLQALGIAMAQPRHQKADGRTRRLGMGQIMDNIGMRLVQFTGGRIMAIALFRHGQRDDFDILMRHGGNEGLRIFGGHKRVLDGTDHLIMRGIGPAHRNSIEPVLRSQRIARVGRAQACPDNAPAEIAGGQNLFGINGLMGAVERAQAQMHNAAAHLCAVITGPLDGRGQCAQGCKRECHSAHVNCSTARITPRNSASPFRRPIPA